MIGMLIRFIGRKTFWKINKTDKIYLQNYYDHNIHVGGTKKIAEEQTKLEKEKIMLKKELKFWNFFN